MNQIRLETDEVEGRRTPRKSAELVDDIALQGRYESNAPTYDGDEV